MSVACERRLARAAVHHGTGCARPQLLLTHPTRAVSSRSGDLLCRVHNGANERRENELHSRFARWPQAGAFENAKTLVRSVDSDVESHYGTIFSVSGPGTTPRSARPAQCGVMPHRKLTDAFGNFFRWGCGARAVCFQS